MNPVSLLRLNRSIRGSAHPFFSVKGNLVNVKNKHKNLGMSVNESSVFFDISLLGCLVFFSFLLLFSIHASISPFIFLPTHAAIHKINKGHAKCISAWLHAKTAMYPFPHPSFITRCPFLQFLPLAPLTATVQRRVPS